VQALKLQQPPTDSEIKEELEFERENHDLLENNTGKLSSQMTMRKKHWTILIDWRRPQINSLSKSILWRN
jgi:hypothetical protein